MTVFSSLMLALAVTPGPLPRGTNACVAADRPFRLPICAVVTEAAGSGWRQNGQMPVTFQAARQQLAAAVRSGGWACQHTIPLGDKSDRVLTKWRKGNRNLTMMVWRIDVDRSGFSWGVSTEKANERNTVKAR